MKYNDMFKERICELMNEQSYTASMVAEKLDIDIDQAASYQTGGIIPSGLVLNGLADLFGVSIDYLMGRTTARRTADPADVSYRRQARSEVYERAWNRIGRVIEYLNAELKRVDTALYQDVKRMNKEKQNDETET